MPRTVVTIRCSPALVERLDAARALSGLSRSAYIEQILVTFWDRDAPILERLDAILARLPAVGVPNASSSGSPPTPSPNGSAQVRAGLQALQDTEW